MEAAPLNSVQSSDLQLPVDDQKTPNLPEDTEVIIAQLPPSKTSTLAPLTPSPELSGKRKRLKPERLEFSSIQAEKKRSYSKDQAGHDPSRKHLRLGKKNATKDKDPVQISPTMIRARELQSTLGNEYPTFTKTMVKSHVVMCFWMGLPLPFCRSFLPKDDSWVVIEDENGEKSNINFIADRSGLSAGWKNFAVGHKLLVGDVLIFQLVESCKFKVYIVRANDSKEVDGAVNVVIHDAHAQHKPTGLLKIINATGATVRTYSNSKGKRCLSSHPVTKVKRKYTRSKLPAQLNGHHTAPSMLNSQAQVGPPEPNLPKVKRKYTRSKLPAQLNGHHTAPSMLNSQDQAGPPEPNLPKVKRKYKRSQPPTQLTDLNTPPSVLDSQVHVGPTEPDLLLKELKTFKDFHIMVDNRCIDSELSDEIRIDYYKLCFGKNEILHNGVREGLYYKLVAGVIGETVNIANVIRNCKLTTRKEEFDVWDSSLESFELIGMKVGFLRDRIRALANHACESEDVKRYVEVIEERNRNANEIKVLEAKLVELYESNKKIDGVVDGLKEKAEKYENEFRKKVDAPW